MKTKPFNLEQYLSDPSQKIVTRNGRPVRIVCWDRQYAHDDFPIIALEKWNNEEYVNFVSSNGRVDLSGQENIHDLFFLDESEELTEFEKALAEAYEWAKSTDRDGFVKEFATNLLNIARKQIYEEFKEFTKLPKGINYEKVFKY